MIDYRSFKTEPRGALYDCGNRLRRRKMMALLPDIQGKTILEAGFGIGDFWIELKRHGKTGYKKYIGVDMSLPNLEKAKHLIPEPGIDDKKRVLVQADIFKLPLQDSSIDILIGAEVLEHLDDLKAMKEMARVLKKGGYTLITVPYLGRPVAGWGHLRHYDLNMIKSLAEKINLRIQRVNIFGRLHEITWVKVKKIFYRIWGVWKKLSGEEMDYYESGFHRYFIMPLVDVLLRIDDLFPSAKSILGERGYLIALLKRQ